MCIKATLMSSILYLKFDSLLIIKLINYSLIRFKNNAIHNIHFATFNFVSKKIKYSYGHSFQFRASTIDHESLCDSIACELNSFANGSILVSHVGHWLKSVTHTAAL